MTKLICTFSLGILLSSSALLAAETPSASDASQLQDAVTSAQSTLSELKGRFSSKPGFTVQGETVKVEVGSTANAFDKDILERQLPRVEDYLLSAGLKLGDAALKLPSNEGYTIFYQGCAATRSAQRQVDVILTKVKHSINFTANDFTGIQQDISLALTDAKCH